jgi:hypothetical protein
MRPPLLCQKDDYPFGMRDGAVANMLRNRIKRLEQLAQELRASTYSCADCRDGNLGAMLTIDGPHRFEPRDDNPIYDLCGRCRKCGAESQNRIIVHVAGPHRKDTVAC